MFKQYYKQSVNVECRQEIRRLQLLNKQKQKRLEVHNHNRNLDKKDHTVPNGKCHHSFQEIYGNEISIQLSEWMREKPNDLNDWLLVPCPRGKRCLITASRGITRMYNKAGRFLSEFRSYLPGDGGKYNDNSGDSRNQCTILDCVYDGKDSYYVLDVIYLSRINLLHCEAQFRFFWLRSYFDDLVDKNLQDITETNWRRFFRLEFYDLAQPEQSSVILQRYPMWPNNTPPLDGFLFYHKNSSYTCGLTPLVCWLFPFMVPDILHMDVSDEYIKPDNYTNPFTYMDDFDKALIRKRKSKKKCQHNEAEHMEEECTEEGHSINYADNVEQSILQECNFELQNTQ